MRKWIVLTACVLMAFTTTTAWIVPEMVLVKAGSIQMEGTGFKSGVH